MELAANQGINKRYWPWILLGVVIAIIWWSQGRNATPLLSIPNVNTESFSTATNATSLEFTNQTVLNELSEYLANKSALTSQTFILRDLNFQMGSSALTAEGNTTAASLAIILNEFKTARIRLIGHTDSVGIDSANQLLSLDRARSLKNVLVAQGVNADRVEISGVGASQPLAENITENGRSQNRRIEIEILEK